MTLIGKFSRALEGKPKRKKNITGSIQYQSVRDKAKQACGYSSEVIVKVSSYGKGPGNALANFGYISRTDANAEREHKDPLELETDRGEILSGKEMIMEYARGWEADFGKPNKRRRDTVRMLMSMPPGTNPEAVREATREFAWKTFGGWHEYVFVLHTDEPHPHCHLTVKMLGHDGTRLNINPEDLANWRELFAQRLRDHGVDATATRRAARGVVLKPEKSVVQRIADHPRKGMTRVPKIVALREREAVQELIAEQKGQLLPDHPWEAHIRAEQDAVRSAWLDVADQLERGQTLSLLPPDHGTRLRSAQVHAAAHQGGLSQRPAIDPRNAPPVTSIKTIASLRTLAQVQNASTGRKLAISLTPIVLLPEDHHDQLKRTQQQSAAYQARLATPRDGEPPRQVSDLAALPRARPAHHGMDLQFHRRRPLKVKTPASIPTRASIDTALPGANPTHSLPPLTFTQEVRHECPTRTEYAAGVYQSNLAAPRSSPSRAIPSVRELPRFDVVHSTAPGRSAAQVLLQQNARRYLGLLAGTDPTLRRQGTGFTRDRGVPGGEGGTPDRQGGKESRGGTPRSGAADRPGRTESIGSEARGGSASRQGGKETREGKARRRPESAGEIQSYRAVDTTRSILRLSDVTSSAASDKALAKDIRAFVAAMPTLETARDVLKRELKARFPAKQVQQSQQVDQAPAQQPSEQEKGADQAAPRGREYGL
jgi:hypothetical protein